MTAPRVCVVLPVYDQAAFVGRAVASLLAQTMGEWELVVVDDGSPTPVADAVRAAAGDDPRIRLARLARNRGLGAACNAGLDLARAPLVTYLPADDVLYADHLAALVDAMSEPDVAMAVTGARHHGDQESAGAPDGFPPQLVQVMHRLVDDRWTERAELESDDLELMYWSRVRRHGRVASTGRVTCEWVDHPHQRHKAIRESYDGGLNVFRSRYAIAQPLRFHSSDGGDVDEVALYADLRARSYSPSADGLRILLAGELAYNPERVLALAACGHRLFGTWTKDGLGASTVGPLPFGHVTEAGSGDPADAVRCARPDVVYGLLNWRAVPYCAAVMRAAHAAGVPFVWHYKEAPQRSIARGEWPLLAELVTDADAVVMSTDEEAEWFAAALAGRVERSGIVVVDGDLPAAHWVDPAAAPALLSGHDGELHTVVVGRALGIDAQLVERLAAARVHIHLYGAVHAPGPKGQWTSWIDGVTARARAYLHLHPPVQQDAWAGELGQYDAGWLHRSPSRNGGDIRRASWDDLNAPARIGPLAVAGVPLLQQRHAGHIVAADRIVAQTRAGLLYDDVDDLVPLLGDVERLAAARAAMVACRDRFTFDAHVPALEAVFRRVARR